MRRTKPEQCEVGDHLTARDVDQLMFRPGEVSKNFFRIADPRGSLLMPFKGELREISVPDSWIFQRIKSFEPNGETIEVWKRIS